jgi:hypothetical protein
MGCVRSANEGRKGDSMSKLVPRVTIALVLVPIAALLLSECGGNDVIDSADSSADATFETSTLDAESDTTLADRTPETAAEDFGPPDAEADGEAALPDAHGGSLDAGDAGTADAGGAVTGDADAGDAGGGADARGTDASNADAGTAEAGGVDASDAEAGGVDAGDAEAGGVDASDAEAGGVDAGDAEAGGVDAGDAEAGSDGGTLVAPALGTAKTFAVLAGSTITNTGATTAIVGDVGVSPGTAITGLPAGQVTGTIHAGDAVAAQAEADLTIAFNNLAGRPCQHPMTGVDLGGQTLPPGVYCFAVAAAQSTGPLTLDGRGDPNAVWIFQIASTLTVSTNLSTTMIGGGNACNVYWQVGSSATINVDAQFKGNILAQASITLLTRAKVSPGRTLTQTAAVTLDSNAISNAGCP